MSLLPPPLNDSLVNDDGSLPFPWIRFFNQSYIGDVGTTFKPEFINLGGSGTPQISGRYYKISQELAYFRVTIVPGVNTTSTAGTTYFELPMNVTGAGLCAAVGGAVGVGIGIIQTTRRVYPPGWSAVTVPVTIVGLVEAK